MFAEFLGFFRSSKDAKGEVMSHYEIKKLKDGGERCKMPKVCDSLNERVTFWGSYKKLVKIGEINVYVLCSIMTERLLVKRLPLLL